MTELAEEIAKQVVAEVNTYVVGHDYLLSRGKKLRAKKRSSLTFKG